MDCLGKTKINPRTNEMTTNPRRKKQKRTNCQTSSVLFPSLPDEIVVSCLARIQKSYYSSMCLVSKKFCSLLSSSEIYAARSQNGATEPRFYVCVWLPTNHSWFTLSEIEGKLNLVPVRLSSSYSPCQARLNTTTVSVGFEIYQIGGTVEKRTSKAVRVLDCRTHTWRRAPSLRVPRRNAKSCFLDGKIYVIGGCINQKDPMNWGEVFDLKTQTWELLRSPSEDGVYSNHNVAVSSDDRVHSNHKVAVFSDDGVDLNHKVAVFGSRLYVITKHKWYAYDPKEGRWLPPEVGLVDLKPITGPGCVIEDAMKSITGPWCVIEDVMFTEIDGKYRWFSSSDGKWLKVDGLTFDLYGKRCSKYKTIQLLNYGGKLVIMWGERIQIRVEQGYMFSQEKRVWCAVIRLEKRLTRLGPQILGDVERCHVVMPTLPKSFKLSSCLSVSI